ncbi:DUF881 domain-containing protein [Nocardioides sp. Kera G14]|uniref:DUF881 domain-containing protein n=1 Tax=Nocardioides sp. Kera G14 TaxID=2884264 RepID=UPI001D11729A|nr:DUF881 domain-containing protein [Nocardioides sp. Kera G14]UDY25247.1 DUF881 domain-containing protein [Nocardioides sp. Kera G14]
MPEPTHRTGRARLLHALRAPRRSQIVAAILLALLGFGAVTQVRTSDADSSFSGYREQDLIDVLNGLAGTSQRAQSEITRLEKSRDDLRDTTSRRQTALDEAKGQVQTLSILAGTVPVTGPGIRLTITEEVGEVSVDSFLDLVQELRSVGAEAIEINDKVRLVAQSSFDQATDGLVVDGKTLEPPYVVEAIGEPTNLVGALTFPGGPEDEFEEDGAEVHHTQLTSLDITSVRPQ